MPIDNVPASVRQNEANEAQEFCLIYLVATDDKMRLGHSSVGVAKRDAHNRLTLIFRVGHFPGNQVQLEDFLVPKPGRAFYFKAFPLSIDQLGAVLIKINKDRDTPVPDESILRSENKKLKSRRSTPDFSNTTDSVEMLTHAENESVVLDSKPGGPAYSKSSSNCKDYALSVLACAGIDIKPFKNRGISLPIFDVSALKEVVLNVLDNGDVQLFGPETKEFFEEKLTRYIEKKQREKQGAFCGLFAPRFSKEEKISFAQHLISQLGSAGRMLSSEYHSISGDGKLGVLCQQMISAGQIVKMSTDPFDLSTALMRDFGAQGVSK